MDIVCIFTITLLAILVHKLTHSIIFCIVNYNKENYSSYYRILFSLLFSCKSTVATVGPDALCGHSRWCCVYRASQPI